MKLALSLLTLMLALGLGGSNCNVLAIIDHYDTNLIPVEEYAEDITQKESESTENREEHFAQLMTILNKPIDNNAVLVGKAGSGKTTLVTELARRIKEDRVPKKLSHKKVIQISFAKVRGKIPGTLKVMPSQLIDLIERAIKHFGRGHIYFMDEFQDVGKEGVSDLMKPLLDDHSFLIFATTVKEFSDAFNDAAVLRRLTPLFIPEANMTETAAIMMKLNNSRFKKDHGMEITQQNAERAATLAIVIFEKAAPQFYAPIFLDKALRRSGKKPISDDDIDKAASGEANMTIEAVRAKLAGVDANDLVKARNDASLSLLRFYMILYSR